MTFIKLHRSYDGKEIGINMSSAEMLIPNAKGTAIKFNGSGSTEVTETMDEIMELINGSRSEPIKGDARRQE